MQPLHCRDSLKLNWLVKANPKTIVLLHALGKVPEGLRFLKTALRQRFPEVHTIVPREAHTREKSIEQQATHLLGQLQNDYKISHEQALILVGHSQGGLRGHALLRQYGSQLNINALVTISTPWEGVPAAICSKELLQNFVNHLKKSKLIRLLNLMHSAGLHFAPQIPVQQMSTALEGIFERLQSNVYQGVVDIKPGSTFLQTTAQQLLTNATPILALAGGPSDFSDAAFIGSLSKKLVEPLIKTHVAKLTKIIGDPAHDLIVPVYSQLAQHLCPAGTFIRHAIPHVVHDHLMDVRLNNVALEHPQVLEKVVTFVAQQWRLPSSYE